MNNLTIKEIIHEIIMINKNLIEILACPLCQGEIIYDEKAQELICKKDHLTFPIIDDIPILIVQKASALKQ